MSINQTGNATGAVNQSQPLPAMSMPEPTQTPVREADLSPQQKMEADLKGGAPQAGEPAKPADVRADNKGAVAEQKAGQDAKKTEATQKTAESGAKAGATTQAVGGGLMAAGAVAACFPPIGTIVGAVLAVVGALVSFFGGESAKEAQAQAQQVQTAEATQKAQADKVANHQRDTAAPEVASGQKSAQGDKLARGAKGAADAGSSAPAAKPSAAAQATLDAGKTS